MNFFILQTTHRSNWIRATVLALLFSVTLTNASTPTYYWDANGSDDGAGDDASGTWGVDPFWTVDYYGDSGTFAYTNRANVIFAAYGDTWWSDVGSYTVTVVNTQQVSDISFLYGTPTLQGGVLDKDTPYISTVGYSRQTATINSVITSAAGTTNGIDKCADGIVILGATNTYLGPTVIEGGTLLLGAPQVLPNTSKLVLAEGTGDNSGTSATFGTGGFSQTLGTLDLAGNNYDGAVRTIDFGDAASTLVFADSHNEDWGGIYLTITGYSPNVDSLRFGTNSAGLTPTQLALIDFKDFLDTPGQIDSQGFVTPVFPVIQSIVPASPASVTITWSTVTNRDYQVQYKLNLNDASWKNGAMIITTNNTTATFTESIGTNSHRFYRITLLPIPGQS